MKIFTLRTVRDRTFPPHGKQLQAAAWPRSHAEGPRSHEKGVILHRSWKSTCDEEDVSSVYEYCTCLIASETCAHTPETETSFITGGGGGAPEPLSGAGHLCHRLFACIIVVSHGTRSTMACMMQKTSYTSHTSAWRDYTHAYSYLLVHTLINRMWMQARSIHRARGSRKTIP